MSFVVNIPRATMSVTGATARATGRATARRTATEAEAWDAAAILLPAGHADAGNKLLIIIYSWATFMQMNLADPA